MFRTNIRNLVRVHDSDNQRIPRQEKCGGEGNHNYMTRIRERERKRKKERERKKERDSEMAKKYRQETEKL
jgi:hypothetical protein